MRVVITGGAGFLGRRLARAILERGHLHDATGAPREVAEVVLADVAAAEGLDDPRVRPMAGDVADPAFVAAVIGGDTDSVFHLAAVVSGEAEANFDLGWRVNFDATRSPAGTLPHPRPPAEGRVHELGRRVRRCVARRRAGQRRR